MDIGSDLNAHYHFISNLCCLGVGEQCSKTCFYGNTAGRGLCSNSRVEKAWAQVPVAFIKIQNLKKKLIQTLSFILLKQLWFWNTNIYAKKNFQNILWDVLWITIYWILKYTTYFLFFDKIFYHWEPFKITHRNISRPLFSLNVTDKICNNNYGKVVKHSHVPLIKK